TVGSFQGGEAENTIPEKAHIKGTLRCFDEQLRDDTLGRIEKLCRHIGEANGAEVAVEKVIGYPPLVNDPAVADLVIAAGRAVLGEGGVDVTGPVLASEDYSFYLQKVPGAFMFVGAGNPEKGCGYPLHHPRFDFDEQALPIVVRLMAGAALKLLEK
ncbi:MAG TPA: M20/M25/M40 family metallo-hydrolase, partial [Negativicutes bacterium]|nr:M20/M25/M40 family metallo-hydrolase [Negativicutes bacterium]